jgi:AcrR family transcriptional regulator
MSQTATAMPVEEQLRRPPRERLLEAARELFYAEGVHTVGIDRVIERAGVAKASLYSTFGSKEGLVNAYLAEYHDRVMGRRRAAAESESDPVKAILAMFDSLARDYQRPDYNGCAFSGARAEEPAGGPVDAAARAYRAEMRDIFRELCVRAGTREPDLLAWQLQLIYSGGAESAKIERNAEVAAAQRAAAATLIASALA